MLAGLNVLASDLDPKMVKGTEENLQWVSDDLCSDYSATWDVQDLVWFNSMYGAKSVEQSLPSILHMGGMHGNQMTDTNYSSRPVLRLTIDHSGSLCTLLPTIMLF